MKTKINEAINSYDDIVKAFADIITNAHPTTAEFVARELYMHGAGNAMAFIINHDNGYGYTDAEEVEFDDNSMNESTSRAMKKVIRLTESDISRMVMEALNELSPNLLGHAFGVADSTGRNIQARNFLSASEEAWNRDYGWENEPDREGILTSCDFHHLSFTDTQLDPTQPTVEEITGSDEANRMATNRLKPAQRAKYFKGVETKKHMQQGLDPNGKPYDLEEAISYALRKYIK